MVISELEHYVVFPGAMLSGTSLLRARHSVIQWAQRARIGFDEHYINGEYRVSLTRPCDYTQFVLQWDGPDFFLVGRHRLTGEPLI
jgi:hypothetical protein